MPQGHHNKLRLQRVEIQERLNIIAPLYRMGWTEREITTEVRKRLDMPKYSQAHRDVQRLLREWRAERLEDTEAKVTSEVARLKLVIREAWAAWERSKEDTHQTSKTQYGLPEKDGQGVVIGMNTVRAIMHDAERRGLGDPRYLDIVLKAEQQICKLLGLDKVVLGLDTGIAGGVEIRYVSSGVPCAHSEEEVRRREGIED